MSTDFHTVGLIARSTDAAIGETAANLVDFMDARGVPVLVDGDGPLCAMAGVQCASDEQMRARCALVVAVGGDGTMLQAASLVVPANIPLVGINRGRLGFLADISPDNVPAALGAVLDGQYIRESRMLLQARLDSGPATLALNDVVVQRYDAGRMVEVEVHISGNYVNTHRGDGLIVCTPTGSTAYALSGGGPIMMPGLDAMAMVPICPHTLSDRPVVVSADSELSLRILEKPTTRGQIMVDGITLADIDADNRLTITRAARRLTLLHPQDYDYFRILRSKLAWGRNRAGQ